MHMSAFGGKADMTIGTCPLSWSLSGVKQTSLVAAHMAAFDPKRTFAAMHQLCLLLASNGVSICTEQCARRCSHR
jgi:hypothetical protein